MRTTLDKNLSQFLRKQRGDVAYSVFARKLGITASSLFRLENGEQSATMKTLQQICDRLKVNVHDVFPGRGS
jgi:transcriptional regulator with XRE-family HTH domain